MANIAATTTVTETTEVQLAPELQHQLLTKLEEYDRVSTRIKANQTRQDELKAEIDQLFTEAGEGNALMNGTAVNGYRVKMICGVTSRLDKKRLVELGCEPAWIAEATETKPSRPYIKITVPGEAA